MKVHYGFEFLPRFNNPVVTVGSYDGVHGGHRQLLGRITQLSRTEEGESVVITFWPHPRVVLGNCGERVNILTTTDEKILLLESLGIDHLIIVPFTEEFSRVSSYDFVHDYLVGKVGVRNLVVGYNHHFGHNHEGDPQYLQKLSTEFGFTIHEIPEQDIQMHKVSSTEIRDRIRDGDMAMAARLLGYRYFMIVTKNGGLKPMDDSKLFPPKGDYRMKLYRAGSLPSEKSFVRQAHLKLSSKGEMTVDRQPDDTFILEFC